jgi:hypothetical protein
MQTTRNFNDMAADKRWVYTMGVLDGARRDLAKLTPNPGHKDGGNAVSKSDQQRPSLGNDRDSLLGSLIVTSLFGADLCDMVMDTTDAPEWVGDIHWGMAINVYDEYVIDREMSRQNSRTKGEYELGERQAICNGFNRSSNPVRTKRPDDAAWDAYWRDLPARRDLEQNIHALNRELDMREKMQFRKLQTMTLTA